MLGAEVRVVEAYGITEVGGVSTDHMIHRGVDVRLLPVPDMGYQGDSDHHGEICVRPSHTFLGYFKDAAKTLDVLTPDGWYRTGDIGHRTADGRVHIIGRLSEVFKLNMGMFVAPAKLEAVFGNSVLVRQVFITHDDSVSALVAVIVATAAGAALGDALPDRVAQDFAHLAQQHSLPSHELPVHIVVDSEPWTPENQGLTPSGKLCRHVLRHRCGWRIAALTDSATQLRRQRSQNFDRDLSQRAASMTWAEKMYAIAAHVLQRPLADIEQGCDRSFLDLGGTSLLSVKFAARINQLLPLSQQLSPAHFLQPTLRGLAAELTFLQSSSAHRLLVHATAEAMDRDCALPLSPYEDSRALVARHCLVTGGAGFLGLRMLSVLLQSLPGDTHVWCLLRNAVASDGERRLVAALTDAGLWHHTFRGRLRVIGPVTMSDARMGLDTTTYTELITHVATIYHVAADTNMLVPYETARANNVLPTAEVLRLAAASEPRKHVHHVSTLSVFGSLEDQRSIAETAEIGVSATQSGLQQSTGYAQSKWVSEKLCLAAHAQGLAPVTIFRYVPTQ
jgi:fatty acid CoA ligase FadD9